MESRTHLKKRVNSESLNKVGQKNYTMKKIITQVLIGVVLVGILSCNTFAQIQHQLWGMTTRGGVNDDGVIFKTDASGNNEMVKQNFLQTGANNTNAYGSLMQASDGKLYGMTWYGGTTSAGSIFQYDPTTAGYVVKYDFSDIPNGRYPQGNSLIQVGTLLYGMTTAGGSADKGILFQYNPATNAFAKKIDFTGIANGDSPYGSLILATDGMLYGMTNLGGANDNGELFQYNPTNNTLTIKVSFDGTLKGKNPYGSLVQAKDGKLYGMTNLGGANGNGVLFQFNPQNNAFVNLWDFDMSTGGQPFGSLIQATDGKLYGLTDAGGTNSFGVLFQYDPAVASSYKAKFNFDSSPNGDSPLGSLIQASDGNLYGMTSMGGASTGTLSLGVIFQYNPSTNTLTNKLKFNGTNGSNPEYTNLIEIPVTITTSAVNSSNCVSASINVPYTIAGAYDDGNVFTAQLSNATGSFTSPVTIGSITSTKAGTINAVIPANTPPGSAYRIRVVANNPVVTGSDNGSNITINALPIITTGGGTICKGNSTTITAGGASTYSWSNGLGSGSSKTVNPTTNITYTVTGTNTNGCINTSSTTVTVKALPSTPTITKNGNKLVSSAISGNQWYFNNVLKKDSINQSYTPKQTGNYFVIVTQNGCSSDTSKNFNVTNVGISELSNNETNINIFPNPINDKFSIVLDNQNIYYNLEILNTTGQIILNKRLINSVEQIDLSGQAAGVYFIKLQSVNNSIIRKIIKQN